MNEKSNSYPVFFMLIVTLVFIGILAVMYRFSEAKIIQNERQEYQLQLLGLFADEIETRGILKKDALLAKEKLEDNFKSYVQELELPLADRKAYEVRADSILLGYCFDVLGNGLWGTMRALIAIDPSGTRILNLSIYKQMETPGLGARIEEPAFRKQFSGRTIYENDEIREFVLIPEDQEASRDVEIRQITGATITSSSVLKMIRDELGQIFELNIGEEE
ncbi:MAG: FMN-binding protein [Candidatus Cloacimonetes bacterium]|nr:FMN-binding protein [Candidatus Cloacimonadota bacterium]